MNKVRVFLSSTFNPWFNLATEDWMFRQLDPKVKTLFLWRNSETVVIGRFQNPWVECRVEKMEEDGVLLARRQSGGGAVFHDLGNTNFTFLSSKEEFSKKDNNHIILEALRAFSIEAKALGRNDLVIEQEDGPKKISGSAFKETKDRSFHHGTLLIKANLERLQNYLNPDKRKIEAKGIKSVRSRVANLTELAPQLDHDKLCQEIIAQFFKFYRAECEIELLREEDLAQIPYLKQKYEELSHWNWRYGETPRFSQNLHERFEWGNLDIHLDSHHGVVTEAKIFSDCLETTLIEEFTQTLKGAHYSYQGLENCTKNVASKYPVYTSQMAEVSTWLKSEFHP